MNLALTLLSSLLLILIFPRFDWTWFAPVALAPLLIAATWERSWLRRFLYGWLGGAIFWGSVCYWIQFVLEVHAYMGKWGGWGTFLLFAAYKGLHLGVFAMLVGPLMGRWWSIPAVAALWTGIERTHGTLAFAWLDLGNAAIGMPVLLRLAPYVGVYGISFVFAVTGCALALILLRRPRKDLLWLAALPLLLLLPRVPAAEVGTRSALVVQPNVDTEAEWTSDSLRVLEENLALLSKAPGVDLVVWPETPAPFYPSSDSFRGYMSSVAERAGADFLMGGVGRTPQGGYLNSAYLLRPDGKIVDRYDKVNLVPFGEYVPPLFSFVNRITNEAGDFVPGNRVVTFPLDSHTLGAFICYESVFPDFVRQFVRNGANVLVNMSNDGYFGGSAAREQHLEIVRMRAVENHRWILRATNDGITAMIDPGGRVTQTMRSYVQASEKMQFNYRDDITPYTQHGDWFAWGCLIGGMTAAAAASYAGSRAHHHP